jgi:hypothetical protein
MFQFLTMDHIKNVKHSDGIIEGIITKNLPHLYGTSQVNGLALRAESVNAFIDWAVANKDRPRQDRTSLRNDNYNGMFGFNSFDEAMDVFKNRPHEIRKFSENDDTLKLADSVGNEIEYDVTGAFIDMGRYLEGTPECMGSNVMGNPDNVIATIILNLSTSGSAHSSSLNYRLQRILRVVDWLERERIRTEIIAVCFNQHVHFECVIKRAEDSLDLNSIAIAAHSDFSRRLRWLVIECSPNFSWGHGQVFQVQNRSLKIPEFDSLGAVIWSDQHISISTIRSNFDRVEKEIVERLAEGDRHFGVNV